MIKKYLDKVKACCHSIKIEEIDYFFLFENDRIYMFILIEDKDVVEAIPKTLGLISTQRNRIKIIEELSCSDDCQNFDIRSFLWDLYLVIIYECDENNYIEPQIVNQIERDRFVARKLVFQGSQDYISASLDNFLRGKEKLEEILQKTEVVFEPEQESLVSDIVETSDTKISESINREIFAGKGRSLKVIDEYLVNLKSKDYTQHENSRG